MVPINVATIGLAITLVANLAVLVWGAARMATLLQSVREAVDRLTAAVGKLEKRVGILEARTAVLEDRTSRVVAP